MFHFLSSDALPFRQARSAFFDEVPRFVFIAVSMLSGLVVGSLIGLFSELPDSVAAAMRSFTPPEASADLFSVLARCLYFPLCAVILSSSILGVILLPALAALRGFVLGCSVSAAIQSAFLKGLGIAGLTVGIPTLISLPAFMLICSDGVSFSSSLLRYGMKREPPRHSNSSFAFSHFLYGLTLILLESLYTCYLLPVLRSALV